MSFITKDTSLINQLLRIAQQADPSDGTIVTGLLDKLKSEFQTVQIAGDTTGQQASSVTPTFDDLFNLNAFLTFIGKNSLVMDNMRLVWSRREIDGKITFESAGDRDNQYTLYPKGQPAFKIYMEGIKQYLEYLVKEAVQEYAEADEKSDETTKARLYWVAVNKLITQANKQLSLGININEVFQGQSADKPEGQALAVTKGTKQEASGSGSPGTAAGPDTVETSVPVPTGPNGNITTEPISEQNPVIAKLGTEPLQIDELDLQLIINYCDIVKAFLQDKGFSNLISLMYQKPIGTSTSYQLIINRLAIINTQIQSIEANIRTVMANYLSDTKIPISRVEARGGEDLLKNFGLLLKSNEKPLRGRGADIANTVSHLRSIIQLVLMVNRNITIKPSFISTQDSVGNYWIQALNKVMYAAQGAQTQEQATLRL